MYVSAYVLQAFYRIVFLYFLYAFLYKWQTLMNIIISIIEKLDIFLSLA